MNVYDEDRSFMVPHEDGKGSTAVILSLCSHAVLDFYFDPEKERSIVATKVDDRPLAELGPRISVLLEPRSALLLTGPAFISMASSSLRQEWPPNPGAPPPFSALFPRPSIILAAARAGCPILAGLCLVYTGRDHGNPAPSPSGGCPPPATWASKAAAPPSPAAQAAAQTSLIDYRGIKSGTPGAPTAVAPAPIPTTALKGNLSTRFASESLRVV